MPRSLRTELVRCGSDTEYLAKLHCIRLAYQKLLSDQIIWHWLADAGRQTLADLLLYADRDPKEFLVAYEAMLAYVSNPENGPQIEQELAARGVKVRNYSFTSYIEFKLQKYVNYCSTIIPSVIATLGYCFAIFLLKKI